MIYRSLNNVAMVRSNKALQSDNIIRYTLNIAAKRVRYVAIPRRPMVKHALFFVFILTLSPALIAAQQIKPMEKSQFIANLEVGLSNHLCKNGSPFLQAYKGNACVEDVIGLYKKCIALLDAKGIIPQKITSLNDANLLGGITAECVSANYMGGDALKAFNLMMKIDAQ